MADPETAVAEKATAEGVEKQEPVLVDISKGDYSDFLTIQSDLARANEVNVKNRTATENELPLLVGKEAVGPTSAPSIGNSIVDSILKRFQNWNSNTARISGMNQPLKAFFQGFPAQGRPFPDAISLEDVKAMQEALRELLPAFDPKEETESDLSQIAHAIVDTRFGLIAAINALLSYQDSVRDTEKTKAQAKGLTGPVRIEIDGPDGKSEMDFPFDTLPFDNQRASIASRIIVIREEAEFAKLSRENIDMVKLLNNKCPNALKKFTSCLVKIVEDITRIDLTRLGNRAYRALFTLCKPEMDVPVQDFTTALESVTDKKGLLAALRKLEDAAKAARAQAQSAPATKQAAAPDSPEGAAK